MSEGIAPSEMTAPQIRLVSASMVASPAVMAVMMIIMLELGVLEEHGVLGLQGDAANRLGVTCTVTAPLFAVGSFLLRKAMEARIPADARLVDRIGGAFVGMAIANAAAATGILYAMATGRIPLMLALCGVSFVATVMHFPTWAWTKDADMRD